MADRRMGVDVAQGAADRFALQDKSTPPDSAEASANRQEVVQ